MIADAAFLVLCRGIEGEGKKKERVGGGLVVVRLWAWWVRSLGLNGMGRGDLPALRGSLWVRGWVSLRAAD